MTATSANNRLVPLKAALNFLKIPRNLESIGLGSGVSCSHWYTTRLQSQRSWTRETLKQNLSSVGLRVRGFLSMARPELSRKMWCHFMTWVFFSFLYKKIRAKRFCFTSETFNSFQQSVKNWRKNMQAEVHLLCVTVAVGNLRFKH